MSRKKTITGRARRGRARRAPAPSTSARPRRPLAVVALGERGEDDRADPIERVLALGLGPKDSVVAVSASGSTPFAVAAVAGSTRLKAGTAQKLILNTISTVAQIRLGRTYGGLKIGVAPANEKLRARARRNVALASGASEERVDEAPAAAGGDARVALVALLAGVDPATARERLDAAAGSVRQAVGS